MTAVSINRRLFQIGLVFAALLCFAAAYDLYHNITVTTYPGSAVGGGVAALMGAGLLIGAGRATEPNRWGWAVLVGVLIAVGSYGAIQATQYAPLFWPRVDNEMIAEFAVETLRRGENPYLWNYTDMLRVYRDQGTYTTLFLDGSVQHRVTYPAFPTLLYTALSFVGLGQVRLVTSAALIVLLAAVFQGAPRPYRPLALLPVIGLGALHHLALIGVQDVVWSALVTLTVIFWRRQRLLAFVLFALAVNFRQQPWFIAPFLVLALWHEPGSLRDRLRSIGLLVGISVGTFLAFNLPFILADLPSWLLGAIEPSYARFNVLSQGLGALTQYELIGWLRDHYTLLGLTTYLAVLWVTWRHPRWLGMRYWLMPPLFFWLYYRGLAYYWYFWIPPLVMVALTWADDRDLFREDIPPRRPRVTLVPLLIGGLLTGSVLLANARIPAPLTLRVVTPIETAEWDTLSTGQLSVEVTNEGHERLAPRFSVQTAQPAEIYPWRIANGPRYVAPGETATYRIIGARAVNLRQPTQVIYTDASQDYHLRTLVDLPLSQPDKGGIINPDWVLWHAGIPAGWSLMSDADEAALSYETHAGRDGLALLTPAEADPVRLSQTITTPDRLSLWVYLPDDPGVRAGITFADGDTTLQVLFAGAPQGTPTAIIQRHTARGVWSQVDLVIAELYQEAALAPPLAAVEVELLGQSASAPIRFGALRTETRTPVAVRAAADPARYYLALADLYHARRDTDAACMAYAQARAHDPAVVRPADLPCR